MLKAKIPKSKLRHELIIDASIEVFVNQGYAALNISNIAKQAGISASHLKYYFPDTGELINAMFKELLSRYESTIQEGALRYLDTEEPRRVLERLIETHIGIIKELKNDLIFAETVAFTARNEHCRKTLDEWIDWYTEHVSSLVRKINPRISRARSYRIAGIIVLLLDNAQRFIAPHRAGKSRFAGFEDEVKSLIRNLIDTA